MPQEFNPKLFLKNLTSAPGVYRMYDSGGSVIYVARPKISRNGFRLIFARICPM